MRSMVCLLKKEYMECSRNGKLIIVIGIFLLFGIMNPATAKLMPYIMKQMATPEAGMGIIVTDVRVDAFTSWQQFYKNTSTAVAAFLLLFSGTFTGEYQKNTLIPVVSKGVNRYKIVIAKSILLFSVWTVCFGCCFGLTYFYNDYYWDNSIMNNMFFGGFTYWLFGMLMIAVLVLFSVVASSSGGVLLGVGLVYVVVSLLGMINKVSDYLPNRLCSMDIVNGGSDINVTKAIAVSVVSIILLQIFSVSIFNKKNL